ncbi:putative clock-controlled protein 6 protein [Botrytis fragariae]|uniref:Putative clock-controlled protein 6 protein n=1 Tax=Botrytis fragariae TaxID=1964551 RepID=A0A8H6AVL4_9HELO|nr:putative clock-controlled protein 6 protein [Botrytis fragariae]KAF5874324.1 putative clock-controlled protein 6 protein [Botrytis fragariae]
MHQPTLLTLAFLLLPLSTLITGLDTDSQAGSGSGSGSETSSGTSNGNLNPNGNANQNQNQNYNTNENENYNSNTNINNNYNINYSDNDNYNIDVNDNDDDDKKDGIVYTTEIVTALTTYCPEATKFEQNGIMYTITEASTLTITDCPCTQTRALPGTALTPAILPQSPLATISPTAVSLAALTAPSPPPAADILPLYPISSLPASILPQSLPPVSNANILAASVLPSVIPAATNPATIDESSKPLNNAVESAFGATPSEIGDETGGESGPVQFLGRRGRARGKWGLGG